MIKMIKSKKPARHEIEKVMRFVERYKGIEAAQDKARQLQQQAQKLLVNMPPSAYKTSLVDFANFVVERTA
jgi:geranylgeranyl pyrophosphate synthase